MVLLLIGILLFVGGGLTRAQEPQTNHVLNLPGEGSYVELPPNLFTNQVVTVEGWFKWDNAHEPGRLFYFFDSGLLIGLGNNVSRNEINFIRFESLSLESPDRSQAPGMLVGGEWVHIAVSVGADWSKIYHNGLLVSQPERRLTWAPASLPVSQNLLGRSGLKKDSNLRREKRDVVGQMDELRIWDHERTPEQIRADLHRRLSGDEPGLLALWNFDDPARPVRDATGRLDDGQLIGEALPQPGELPGSNLVLDLPSEGSYVELPPNLFSNDVITVEGWFKDRSFHPFSSIFVFSDASPNISIVSTERPEALAFWRFESPNWRNPHVLSQRDVLVQNRWTHIAVVSSADDARFYANGIEITSAEYAASDWQPSDLTLKGNLLGRLAVKTDPNRASRGLDFTGQMDELRIWDHKRTAEQIRANLHRRLGGYETGLLALWNFDDPARPGRDASGRLADGELFGDATVIPVEDFGGAVSFSGVVRNEDGVPVADATVELIDGAISVASSTSDTNGVYRLVAQIDSGRNYDLRAAKNISDDDPGISAWVLDQELTLGEQELDFVLTPSAEITCRVEAFDGSPISVLLQVIDAGATAPGLGVFNPPGLRRSVWLDESGEIKIQHARPGDVEVLIHLPSGQLRHSGGSIHVEPGSQHELEFTVAPFRKGELRRFSASDGLPDNSVFDIEFDENGRMWLATLGGLTRFDGAQFVSFGAEAGLPDDDVFCLNLASDGKLWIGSETGLSEFDPVAGQVIRSFSTGENGLTAGRVFDLERAPDGALWIRTGDGLTRYADGTFQKVFDEMPLDTRLSGYKGSVLAIDGDVASSGRPRTGWDLSGWKTCKPVTFGLESGLNSMTHGVLEIAPDGTLWFQDEH